MMHCHCLDIETSSLCNRRCSTCIRNSNPDRAVVSAWFKQTLMPMETIKAILDQAVSGGFRGGVILSHYNEPLLDPRIADIAILAKSYETFSVRLVTNGDLLTPELASKLDGVLDGITISLYMPAGPERKKRQAWFKSLFKKTHPFVKTGVHGMVHWHPDGKPAARINDPCHRPRRITINHRGQYLLCCDDMTGHFGLGTFPAVSLTEYWYGRSRARIVARLEKSGGRRAFPYCATCPREDCT